MQNVDSRSSLVAMVPAGLRPLVRRGGIGTGCLIVIAVILVILIAGGIFVAMSWKGWAATGIREGSKSVVAGMQVSAEDKARVNTRIDQLAGEFEQGRLSFSQLGQVLETIAKSPVLPVGAVQFFDQNYIDAKLPEEERADARKQLQRFARGIYEQKVPPEMINVVMIPISDSQPGNQQRQIRPPDQVSVEQVKEFVANAKARADEYKIPDEPFQVNIADELIKAIDQGVGIAPATPTAPSQPTGTTEPTTPSPAPAPAPGG